MERESWPRSMHRPAPQASRLLPCRGARGPL